MRKAALEKVGAGQVSEDPGPGVGRKTGEVAEGLAEGHFRRRRGVGGPETGPNPGDGIVQSKEPPVGRILHEVGGEGFGDRGDGKAAVGLHRETARRIAET
ncbi:hypothetical protein RZS08_66150, partial [Arthrospira platensis SPKY1]|nr:hypothetical protein [Arthrospira platensis SPKY1]